MKHKKTALLILVMPGLAMLGACSSMMHHDKDGMAMSSSSMSSMSGDQMSFADMDKNHNGSLTKDELSASDMLYQHFSTADADNNGSLSEAEVMKHRADMAASGK